MEFANIIGNTTCRMDDDGNSCYYALSNPMYDQVSEAFVSHIYTYVYVHKIMIKICEILTFHYIVHIVRMCCLA